MLQFEKEQSIVSVGEVEIGGQPGELPTVLIGSIFYEGHGIVEDSTRGIFDRRSAGELIEAQDELSDKTGNPCMVDVVGLTPQSMEKYLDFVLDATDSPVLIDSSSMETKMAGVRYAKEVGALERSVYNSISHHVKDEEVSALRDVGVKSAIILALNPVNPLPRGRVEVLMGSERRRGLIKVAEEAGLENLLIDAAVLDVPSIGLAAESIQIIKNQLGLPSGGAPLNAVLEWEEVVKLGDKAKNVCSASSAVILCQSGADFILYGPIGKANIVFPAVALADAIALYRAKWHGVRSRTKDHPLYKIF
ncbi:MAG: tetrahydromethanopterin S-methyltransferase subunit H [Candidatus Geothermarchaeales archaeon]